MNKRETVQALLDSVQQGDFENAKAMLADDFHFSGPVPEPINKEAWLGMSASLKTAFPDLNYHFKVIGTEGDVVRSTSQLSGTHSGEFDLTTMQMGVIPATHKSFSVKVGSNNFANIMDPIWVLLKHPCQNDLHKTNSPVRGF